MLNSARCMTLGVRAAGLIVMLALLLVGLRPALADLRSAPVWYDQNAVSTTPDWHYRVPINVPAGATVNSTVKVDVDFATLLGNMGVSGTFDVNSPRVVRSTGALSTNQQFTDTVYAGATDTAGNGRGEVRFILQDAGAVTYYLYFDITQNGSKPVNPQVPINGNFEFGAVGTATPTGWASSSKVNAAFDTQIVDGTNVAVNSDGAPINNNFNTNGSPNTGLQSYLIGARTNNEPVGNKNATQLNKTITVPATTPGNLTVRWKIQGYDSDINGGTNGFDHFKVSIISGASTTQIIGPAAKNYVTRPFAPAYGTSQITATTYGYGAYNSWDMGTDTIHDLGMTVPYTGEPWWTFSYSLAAFAGQTITLRIETGHVTLYRSWALVDDIEWSVVTATLGTPQAFGVNITLPAAGGTYVPGQAISTTVQVNAAPTAATDPMTVGFFTPAGVAIGGTFKLFNDGTHGDATANDAIWSNNNSVPADPAPTVPLSATNGSNYILRAYGKDGSTSTIGAQNGLIRGPGTGAAAETQANYWNIDEILFNVSTAALTLTKTNTIINDPVNGTTNPKFIPGARVRYCILATNAGPLAATTLVMTDTIPAQLTYAAGTIKSGTSCAGATTVEDDDSADTGEPDLITASYSAGNIAAILATLASAGGMAITFEATVN